MHSLFTSIKVKLETDGTGLMCARSRYIVVCVCVCDGVSYWGVVDDNANKKKHLLKSAVSSIHLTLTTKRWTGGAVQWLSRLDCWSLHCTGIADFGIGMADTICG